MLQGPGTREHVLNRVLVSRSEIDLQKIVVEYRAMYGRSLQDDIKVKIKKILFFLIPVTVECFS